MSLLPKTEIDFIKTEYWDKFFKERGSKEFEWYGEYAELCGELHKYLKKENSILVVGCGNSMLSSNLYDVGLRNITSIDISSVVINQMKNKVGNERPEMVFEQMDALNMTYEEEKFDVVIDKGTLDALMPSDTIDDRKRAGKLFSEIERVLRINGRYVIISLLQRHILEEILSHFTNLGWMIRITRCWDVEKKKITETGSSVMPVFMVVCMKLKKMQTPLSILEVNVFVHGRSERVTTKEEVMRIIEGLQKTFLCSREAKDEIEIKFCRNGEEKPRYSIYIVDVSRDMRHLYKYAAFIVPHGRETEWMFGTTEGRSFLRDSSGFDRLAVVTFHRNQEYGTMEEIQDELRQTILQWAPPLMPTGGADAPKLPFLTLGDGVGYRKTIYSGTSEFSGNLIVEEVEIEKEMFRRLIFLDNQGVVQSEVKLKKGKKKAIDLSHIASGHILYMSIPAAMLTSSTPSIAVIGLGGGGLCLFLHKLYPKASVTAVEIDPVVVELARKYFGFQTDERLQVVIQDGVEFVKNRKKFDIIMFDVDSKEQGSAVSCPPKEFVEPEVLKSVADSLGNSGIFVTNVVSRVESDHEKLIKKIRKHFKIISWYNLKEDVNRIVFATNMSGLSKEEWQQKIKDSALALDKKAQEKFNMNCEVLDINHLVKELSI